MPTAAVNGIQLHYEIQGQGEPLLLISGLGANRLSWLPVVPLLAEQFQCITFDNRGTGQSDVPPGPYTMDALGDDAAALVAQLNLGPVHAVGWSMGGSVLQSMLIHHPEHLQRAVLLSTLPAYTDIQHHWLDALLALRRTELDDVAQGVIGMPWGFTARTLSDHTKLEAVAQLAAQNPYPTTYEGFAAQAAAIRVYDSRPHLPEVRTPTLVLVGAEDVLTPVHQSVEMAQLMPSARLQVLPRGGHAMAIEYAEDTVAAIREFLMP
jgi:3-oxoadipate enol-lactonase